MPLHLRIVFHKPPPNVDNVHIPLGHSNLFFAYKNM